MGKRSQTFTLFILCIFIQANVFSQLSNTEKSDFLDAEYFLDLGDYQKAVKLYVKLISSKPDNANFNYRAGQSYMKILGEEGNALPYLEKAVKSIDKNYIPGNFKSESAPAEAWILLGDSYHRVNRLDDASNAYNQYLKYIGNDEKAQDIIYRRISGLALTRSGLEKPITVQQKNIGGIVNSKYSDYNPVLSSDQRTLVFTSYRESKDRILSSYYANGSWSSPVDITTQIGSAGDFYTTSISSDGNELYLSIYDPANADIYLAKKDRGRWTKCIPLEKPINSKYNESSASISRDGNILYFSSDRPGGEGGFDIYSSTMVNGKWSKPVNLGNKVNTKGDEEWPYITPDDNTLFFSSDGHESIGGSDILSTQMDRSGEWKQPVNLGIPYNTPDDELAYTYFPDTKTGYISRNLPNGFGKKDLYVIVPKDKMDEAPVMAKKSGIEIDEQPFSPIQVGSNEPEPQNNIVVEEPKKPEPVVSPPATVAIVPPVQKIVPEVKSIPQVKSEPVKETPKTEPVVAEKPKAEPVVAEKAKVEPIVAERPKTEPVVKEIPKVEPIKETPKPEPIVEEKPKTDPVIKELPKVEPAIVEKPKPVEKTVQPTPKVVAVNTVKTEKPAIVAKPKVVTSHNNTETNISKYTSTGDAKFTIQVMALKKPTELSRFSKLEKSKLKLSIGNDGFSRYTYGEFNSLNQAIDELKKIAILGYKDAFVKEIKAISNY